LKTERKGRPRTEDEDEHEMRGEWGVRARLKAALHAPLPLESFGGQGRSFGARVRVEILLAAVMELK
jgi:hypothetical protein